MATNEGILAVLALWKELPERQRQLLLALETFPPSEDGWREAGTELLARTANLAPRTVAKARAELVKAGLIDYRRGISRTNRSTYRPKVAREVATFKGGKREGHLRTGEGGKPGPAKVANRRFEGGKRNALTSANASGALKESALKPSAPARGPAEIVRAAFPGATDDEIETITKDKISSGARSPEAVLAYEIRQGTLRLPCNPRGPGSHSGACRDGNPAGCVYDWCACRCHTPAGEVSAQ